MRDTRVLGTNCSPAGRVPRTVSVGWAPAGLRSEDSLLVSGLVDRSATPSEQDWYPHIKQHLRVCHPEAWPGLVATLSGKLGGETAKRRETRRRELQNEPGRGALRPVPGAPARAAPAALPRHRSAPRAGPRLPGGGEKGPGPGPPRHPLLRARRERPSAPPALSASRPSLRCPRPRSLFGAETPLTSEPLARRSPAPRARPGPQTARRAAQPSLAGPPPALPAASPSLPGPPGLPPPRSASSSAGTDRRAALLAAAARAVSPVPAGTRAPGFQGLRPQGPCRAPGCELRTRPVRRPRARGRGAAAAEPLRTPGLGTWARHGVAGGHRCALSPSPDSPGVSSSR